MGINELFTIVGRMAARDRMDILLIGGFAVNHHGYTRNTLDVDFMVCADDMERVRSGMIAAGYSNIESLDNALLFQKPGFAMRADFLIVDRTTMGRLMKNCHKVSVDGTPLNIPSLPDLIAMKLFAISHGGAARYDKDMPDVAFLCVLNGLDAEKDLRPLCEKHADMSIYRELLRRIESLKAP